jgi:tripartite-type tricarboxylate transporter receptor subunit TctC
MRRIPCLATVLLVAAPAALAAAPADPAAGYPSRPIRMVVPFPPGAASDFLARTVGQKLGELYGQQIVVDNRPGAGGIVGSTILSKAAPDGYTLGVIGQPHIVNMLLQPEQAYRPIEDVATITLLAVLPNVVVVAPNLPVNSLADLVALAKAKPGQLNFGSAGVGSSSHLAGELFKSATGVNVVHVPFKQLSDVFTEMIAGRVHYYVFPLPAVMPMLRDGKLRPIAVATAKRTPSLPDLPTSAESGVAAYLSESWFGAVAPAKTSRTIVDKLNADIVNILKAQDTRERFQRQGAEPVYGTPEEFQALMKSEYARFQKLVRDAGIKAQ